MKNKRKLCAAIMLISLMPQNPIVKAADDGIITGSCYEPYHPETKHCMWILNKNNGTLAFENLELSAVGRIESAFNDAQKELVKYGIIANGTKKILNYPFRDFPNLKNVSLPDTITEIRGFFAKCPHIEELTLSNDIKVRRLCHECNGLKTINFGSLVSPFKDATKHDWISHTGQCPNLISVNVAEGNESFKSVKGALLTKDGENLSVYPFGRTSKAIIPYGVKKTFEDTFTGCPFTSITIPETVENILDAFQGCNNLSTINFFGIQEPTKSNDYSFCGSDLINVPHDYNGTAFWDYPVQKVIDNYGYLNDECTFWMTQENDTQMTVGGDGDLDSSLLADDGSTWKDVKDKIKKVVIDDGITTVDMSVFSNFKNLQEVTLPESIDRVEVGAFFENSSLKTINYLGKNPPNCNFTFKNPPNVLVRTDYNGDELFGVNVSKVFGSGVHEQLSWMFDTENTLTIKGTGIIERYNPLGKFKKLAKRLVIEDGITSIETAAFYGYDFMDVKLPNTLETIGRKAFGGCKNLNSITLPTSLKTLGEHVFDGCHALTEICVEDGNNAYCDVDGVLFSKPDLALVQYPTGKGGNYTVPENVTAINDSAFCNTEIESVTIEGSLQSIGRNAFYGCRDLKFVYIDGEVDRVDDNAFAFCESLSEVEYEGEPKLGENVFFGCDKLNTTTI